MYPRIVVLYTSRSELPEYYSGGLYSVSFVQWLTHQDCCPSSLLMHCVPCALLDHGTHDPLLDIPKQSLLLVINTFWYQVQLLVPAGLFTHAIFYMILAYHFWHFYACCLPMVSQGNWVSFYSTLLFYPLDIIQGSSHWVFLSLSLVNHFLWLILRVHLLYSLVGYWII